MRIALFDWTAGGHHELYVRRAAEALAGSGDVTVAVPDETATRLADLPVDIVELGPSRDVTDRALADREADLFARLAAERRPDRIVHLYGDGVLRRLVRQPPLPVPSALVMFYASAHYPRVYGNALTREELTRAWFLEMLVARWRRRRDAWCVFTLDPYLAQRWARRRGAPAHWFPEPPVGQRPPAVPRSGAIVYGALSPHKGLDAIVDALCAHPVEVPLTLAGPVRPGFEHTVEDLVGRLRAAGGDVATRFFEHTEAQGLEALARARCAILAYPRHSGMSRVLLEACAMGTPVVVHEHGLLARLVRDNGLGIVVDREDRRALSDAVRTLTTGPDAVARYEPALARFAAAHAPERFQDALVRPLTQRPDVAAA
jgi:glycosyltransferase involved in cell wall biosynthesis